MSTVREQRAAPRRRIYFAGEIVRAESDDDTACVVRNISASGARLRLPTTAPSLFDLRILREGSVRRVRKVWQNGEECGVAFVGEDAKTPATPLPIMVLRRSLRFQAVDEN
jgi:hypothetical protein